MKKKSNHDDTVLILTKLLQVYCDPFQKSPWETSITKKMVLDCVSNNSFEEKFNDGKMTRHAERIAFFVKNGYNDYISIDVGIPSLGFKMNWFIVDGNHRFASSIINNHKYIKVQFSGDVDYFNSLFFAV